MSDHPSAPRRMDLSQAANAANEEHGFTSKGPAGDADHQRKVGACAIERISGDERKVSVLEPPVGVPANFTLERWQEFQNHNVFKACMKLVADEFSLREVFPNVVSADRGTSIGYWRPIVEQRYIVVNGQAVLADVVTSIQLVMFEGTQVGCDWGVFWRRMEKALSNAVTIWVGMKMSFH